MEKAQNPPPSKCEIHSLILKAHQRQRKHNLTSTTSFCKKKTTCNKKKTTKTQANLEGPMFNKDRNYATPAFILPSEKIEYIESAREYIRDHDKKVREYEEHLDELYIAKPRTKNMYCNVCRENYQEYLDHIRSQKHKFHIRSSEFNKHILELEEKYNSRQIKESNDVNRSTQEEEDEVIEIFPRKMLKTDSHSGNANQFPQGSFYPYLGTPFPTMASTMAPQMTQIVHQMNPQMAFSPQMGMSPHVSMPHMGISPQLGQMGQMGMPFSPFSSSTAYMSPSQIGVGQFPYQPYMWMPMQTSSYSLNRF